MWIVDLEESGEYQEFKTKKAAMEFLKEVKRFDKENGIVGEKYNLYRDDETGGDLNVI